MNVENKDDFRVVAFFTSSVGRTNQKDLPLQQRILQIKATNIIRR
jgi:hypothetical protein